MFVLCKDVKIYEYENHCQQLNLSSRTYSRSLQSVKKRGLKVTQSLSQTRSQIHSQPYPFPIKRDKKKQKTKQYINFTINPQNSTNNATQIRNSTTTIYQPHKPRIVEFGKSCQSQFYQFNHLSQTVIRRYQPTVHRLTRKAQNKIISSKNYPIQHPNKNIFNKKTVSTQTKQQQAKNIDKKANSGKIIVKNPESLEITKKINIKSQQVQNLMNRDHTCQMTLKCFNQNPNLADPHEDQTFFSRTTNKGKNLYQNQSSHQIQISLHSKDIKLQRGEHHYQSTYINSYSKPQQWEIGTSYEIPKQSMNYLQPESYRKSSQKNFATLLRERNRKRLDADLKTVISHSDCNNSNPSELLIDQSILIQRNMLENFRTIKQIHPAKDNLFQEIIAMEEIGLVVSIKKIPIDQHQIVLRQLNMYEHLSIFFENQSRTSVPVIELYQHFINQQGYSLIKQPYIKTVSFNRQNIEDILREIRQILIYLLNRGVKFMKISINDFKESINGIKLSNLQNSYLISDKVQTPQIEQHIQYMRRQMTNN